MNNKGFTLIELLAVIVLLAIIAGIGSYSITRIVKNSKDKNYELLIKNIKDAAEVYYQECRYANKVAIDGESHTSNGVDCLTYNGMLEGLDYEGYVTQLGKLVKQGYLTGNAKDNAGNDIIVNPQTDGSIAGCYIGVGYAKGSVDSKLVVIALEDPSYDFGDCPKNTDYGDR